MCMEWMFQLTIIIHHYIHVHIVINVTGALLITNIKVTYQIMKPEQ